MSTWPVYTADGSTSQFDFAFEYDDAATLRVTVNRVSAPFTLVNPSRVQITTTPPAGAEVEISRVTDVEDPAVDFTDGAVITGDQLNRAFDQVRFRAIELGNDAEGLKGRSLRVPAGEAAPLMDSLADADGKILAVINGRVSPIANEVSGAEQAALDAEAARDAAEAARDATESFAANAEADRVATEAAADQAALDAAAADETLGLIQSALLASDDVFTSTYTTNLPKGVVRVDVGGAVSGATPGRYALTGTGGSITGWAADLVVVSATEARVEVVSRGLGTGTTPPTLTKPAGATLPTGVTLTAVVDNLIPNQGTYFAMTADSSSIQLYRNNGGSVASVLYGDGSSVTFPNAREVRRFVARQSVWRNTNYVVSNPHLLRVRPNLVMTDGSAPPDCYVYDVRRDNGGARCVVDIKRVSDNLRIGALATTTAAAPAASPINPTTHALTNGGIGLSVLPLILTTEAVAAGFSSASTVEIDFLDGGTWGAVQDGTATTHLLNGLKMGLGAAERGQVSSIAIATVTTLSRLFAKAIPTDSYVSTVFKDGVIGNGDPDDDYFLNYETMYFPGIPLYRFKARLHSTKHGGAEVARWDFQKATVPTADDIPAQIHLTYMADGAHAFGNDPGITAILDVDYSAIQWTKGRTAYTTAANTGIARGKVQTTEATRSLWNGPAVPPYRTVTVGATNGQYSTIVAAIAALTNPYAAGTITRTTYPSTHWASPERPLKIVVVDPLTEAVTPYTASGVDQSPLRLPHGSILETRPDTLIYMDHPTSTAPVIEMNYTARITGGGTVEQRGNGYILHIDNGNGISDASPISPKLLRRRIQTLVGDVVLLKTKDNTVPHIGAGLSNGQDLILRGTTFKRPANTAICDYVFVHNSPEETHAGRVIVEDVQTDINPSGPVTFLTVSKSHASDIVHSVVVRNSDVARLKVFNQVTGSAAGWRKGAPMPGIAVNGTWAA